MTTFKDSTIPGFTAALQAGLQAQLGGSSKVRVCDGPATPDAANAEQVIELLDAEVEVGTRMDSTTQPRTEDGSLNVLITVQTATRGKQTNANALAFALLSALNQLLRSRTDLQGYYDAAAGAGQPGGAGFIAGARVARVKHTKRSDPNSQIREAGLDVTVIWKARLI